MNFDTLDTKMRRYETNGDRIYFPETYLVVRLDGRSFTNFTRDMGYEKPFDAAFNEHMVETTLELMKGSGFDFLYGFTQSDEISLLLKPGCNLFERKERKLVSILAGLTSAQFALRVQKPVTFDARVCQMPTKELVVDYFRWRQEDATRNALNGYCYWTLRKEGMNPAKAAMQMAGINVPAKNELLFQRGIDFQDVTAWQKRGVGVTWQDYKKTAYNPYLDCRVEVARRQLQVNRELPVRDEYTGFLKSLLEEKPNE